MEHCKCSPVSGELLLNGGDDELLHFLVRLGDQVNWRALLHDTDVILQSLANHLEANTCPVNSEGHCLTFYRPMILFTFGRFQL